MLGSLQLQRDLCKRALRLRMGSQAFAAAARNKRRVPKGAQGERRQFVSLKKTALSEGLVPGIYDWVCVPSTAFPNFGCL